MGFLQVILLILKIIGILLVSVFGLLVLAVVLVLFVPVRYRADGHRTEGYGVNARVTWLLHLVHVKIIYDSDTKLLYEVRVLGWLFLSSDEAWKTANEEKKKKKAESKAQKQKEKRAKAKAKRKKKKQVAGRKQGQPIRKVQSAGTDSLPISANADKETVIVPDVADRKSGQSDADAHGAAENTQQEDAENNKKILFARIGDKIRAILQKIKEKCRAVWKTVTAFRQKADSVVAFLKEETNKAAFGASWTTLVQILKHLGPTKIRGYLAFGMEDPATTGYILAVLGIFYGKYGKSFSIRPNFEEKQFETELSVKGRIRMSRLLWLVWKLWKNKDFKSLLENIKQLKSDISTTNGG